MDSYRVEVVDRVRGGEAVRLLLVDGKEESATYLDDKKYELIYPYILEIVNEMEKHNFSKVLLLGGGGFSIPKYYINRCQEGRIDVVEKFEEIYEIAKKHFFVSDLIRDYEIEKNGRMNVFILDAKNYLQHTTERYNIIINDAYNAGEMVEELLTEETISLIVNLLEKNGVYIINFFSALEGHKRKIWDLQEKILKKYFSRVSIKQVDLSLLKKNRQNFIVAAKK